MTTRGSWSRRAPRQPRIPDGNYDHAHVELYAIGTDATAVQVADTSRGDLRVMARVSVLPSAD